MMRIQARIFMVVPLLILAVVSVQVWLHVHQMRAVERSLGVVATTVGRAMLTRELDVVGRRGLCLQEAREGIDEGSGESGEQPEVFVEVLDGDDQNQRHVVRRVIRHDMRGEHDSQTTVEEKIDILAAGDDPLTFGGQGGVWHKQRTTHEGGSVETRVLYLQVSDDHRPGERVLVISNDLGEATEIPIPTSPTMDVFRATFKRGLAASALLLGVGLLASAVVARKLARPLQSLAAQSEHLARGGFGTRVPVTTSGEIGELEAAFDRMSVHLAELERERDEWRRREHLAQLGDLSRGLAHTIRNPLHTLGLAVEELAGEGDDPRVSTARKQIRRIDRWIRSFLALGAEGAASRETVDLAELVQECLLEVSPDGIEMRFESPDASVGIKAVPSAIRAALSNLIENAIQASPAGSAVEIHVGREGEMAQVTIRDWGPGVPAAIRARLFEPHQTTRHGGAGMGLYLARQLIEEMHGGTVLIDDGEGGGTLVRINLPSGRGTA